ncbi:PREDICTED: uncharacterized protein LOC104806874 isoform X2 [Tarenaya hassleriana]|uniref:uncharacterized protein LOC104806874 isoform X2 n=1 Tax=Tarenaya hassleriana TaxID=28532 RepID=UPI0008FD6879|nr:PREDICTED: uncharacterized protein LOC104806874 isoform X2 [Tarenaya hassleriana]
MTLEDFFTLTEIKDGLAATSRVEELVSVMQRSKDSVVKNAGDASRQWAAVASTIAATKNRECLDAFIDLDGLFYFSRWLIDAQRLGSDSTDSSVEEAILALLQALENLGVDYPNLISSGIWHSVRNLDDHGSSRIQDMARKLFDSWKQDNVHDRPDFNKESIHRLHEDEARVISASGESISGQIPDANPLCPRESNNEKPPLGVVDEAGSSLSEENKADEVKGLELQTELVGSNSNVISHCSYTKAEASDDTLIGEIMNAVQESLSVKENDSTKDTSGTSGLRHPQHGSVGRPSGSPASSEISKDDSQIGEHEPSAENLGAEVVAAASSLVEPVPMSIDTAVASPEETKKEPLSEEASKNSSGALEDIGLAHNCSKQVAPMDHKSDKYDSEALSGLSADKKRNREDESFGAPIHAVDEAKKDGKGTNNKKIVKRRKRKFSRSMTVSQRLGAMDKSTAEIELGIVDALDIAAKVAQEVAREVDSREPSCDSSEELSDERTQSDSSNSINDDQDMLGTVSHSKEAPVFEKHSAQALQGGKNHLMDLEDDIPENGMSGNKIEPRQFSTERKPCEFDLNEEIVPDETDVAVASMSTLAPVVTVSRPVAAPGVPPAMVSQLERTVCWKGSAATSAFRPASPHKLSGGDLREKHVCLGIDLNVAEGEDDKVEDSTPWRQFPFSTNARSTETLVEVKPSESGRFNLDLNCRNEEYDAPTRSELRMETRLFLNRNGHQSVSPASCSSSQQSAKKLNFDLNDGPQFLTDSSYQGPYYGQHPRSTIPHEPVISILGAKVEVSRKDSLSFFPKGKSIDPKLDLDIARTGNSLGLAPGFSHSPSPTFGYNGQTAPPGLTLSSPLYVPGNSIPYMMDSRGAPVLPRVIGSTPHAHAQQHFFMSMPDASTSLNGFPNFEGGSREILSLTQFLSRGQSGPTGEHAGASFESSSGSSIVGGKRKEPETGWEPYTLNSSRPQYPPWR